MHKPGLSVGTLSEGICENRRKKAEGRAHFWEGRAVEGGKRGLWLSHGAKQGRPFKATMQMAARADLWGDGQVWVRGVGQHHRNV